MVPQQSSKRETERNPTAIKVFAVLVIVVWLSVWLCYSAILKNNNFSADTQPSPIRHSAIHRDDDDDDDHVQVPPNVANKCNYVGFELTTGPGMGNYLFIFSAVTYIAWLTERRPCVWTSTPHRALPLDSLFDIDIPHLVAKTVGCPLHRFKQKGPVAGYDLHVESLTSISHNTSLVVRGYFQSWKYVEPVAEVIRKQLGFRRKLTAFVNKFFSAHTPPHWASSKFVRVGVHVRRGDFLLPRLRRVGYTTVDESYLRLAMNYFAGRFARVQFIVASNDIRWCKEHIKRTIYNSSNVDIAFSVGHNAAQDLALLAHCNHTIMSSGTFSWWAAWLANGTTVYYANYPRRESPQSRKFNIEEYYHPNWIGME